MSKSRKHKAQSRSFCGWKGGPNLDRSIYYPYKDYVRSGKSTSETGRARTDNDSNEKIKSISNAKVLELKAYAEERRVDMDRREKIVFKKMKKAA